MSCIDMKLLLTTARKIQASSSSSKDLHLMEQVLFWNKSPSCSVYHFFHFNTESKDRWTVRGHVIMHLPDIYLACKGTIYIEPHYILAPVKFYLSTDQITSNAIFLFLLPKHCSKL